MNGNAVMSFVSINNAIADTSYVSSAAMQEDVRRRCFPKLSRHPLDVCSLNFALPLDRTWAFMGALRRAEASILLAVEY